ncbi:MAG: hypothetical protein R3318_06690, partial [Gammaproteobacteria bacterium]|nr:hypothetical protein [Gammaproteobacteria bacterium]
MKACIKTVVIILVFANLVACGFQMRGSNLDNLGDSTIFIQSRSGSDLALELKKHLAYSDISVSDSPGNADYIIALDDETYERDILSVSAETGKVEEYELFTSILLSIRGPDGKKLVTAEPLVARRDYIFNQDSALGKFDEE